MLTPNNSSNRDRIRRSFNRTLANSIPLIMGLKGSQRLSILIYHRVLPAPDYMRPIEPTVDQFNWQMELLAENFCPLSMSEALKLMDADRLPDRAVCVTFDDGYADNETLAFPILKKWGVPATVFVSTKYLNGGRMWNDTVIEAFRIAKCNIDMSPLGLGKFAVKTNVSRRDGAQSVIQKIKYLPQSQRQRAAELLEEQIGDLPSDLMLNTAQLRSLHAGGVEIGGHTHSHPILSALPDEHARDEIIEGKQILEEIIDRPVRFFAYPNGIPGRDYKPAHRQMVREAGFQAALSTRWGVSNKATDRWQLNRFTPWDRTPFKFYTRLLLNISRLH